MDLQKIKTYAEGILAEIATGTAPQPLPEPVPEPTPDPVPTPVPVPPAPPVVGGAVAKDVADIIAKLKAGDKVIKVRKGNLGALALNGIATAAAAIEAEDPSDAATFSAITQSKSPNITIRFLNVVPTAGNKNDSSPNYLIKADGGLWLEQMTIKSRDDADHCMDWAKADWLAWAWSGVQFVGSGNVARGCRLFGVNFGLSTIAPDNDFLSNAIFGVSADGIRLNGDRCRAISNKASDFVLIDANHPDALQAFGKYNSTAKTYADLTGLVIEDNEFTEWTVNPSNPLRAKMQGIGGYNGKWINASVKRNKIKTTSYTGITINNLINGAVEDNYMGNIDKVSADCARFKVSGSGNSIARNQSPHFLTAVDATNVKAPF